VLLGQRVVLDQVFERPAAQLLPQLVQSEVVLKQHAQRLAHCYVRVKLNHFLLDLPVQQVEKSPLRIHHWPAYRVGTRCLVADLRAQYDIVVVSIIVVIVVVHC
jgi:hypothetical protein